MPDVAVIGAGPAGSLAAALLARRGWSVSLIEQHRFPRDKVCGECLSALGIETLSRVGFLDELRKRRPTTLSRANIHTIDGRSHSIALASPIWGLSRRVLDQGLLEMAIGCGAKLLQPARCEGIEAGERCRLRVRHLEGNRIQILEADWVIVAEGKGYLSESNGTPTGDFGIKTHFEAVDAPPDTIELFGGTGSYGGLAPIEQGRWNAAFSVPARRLRDCRGNIEAQFEQIRQENEALDRRLAGARRVSDWLAAPLPRFGVARHWPARVIPVGNAAAAIEPIGGEGMGLALRSAEMAAQCLMTGKDAGWLRREYWRLWNIRRVACRAAGMVVSSPQASRFLLPLLDLMPHIGDVTLRLLGKSYRSPSISAMA